MVSCDNDNENVVEEPEQETSTTYQLSPTDDWEDKLVNLEKGATIILTEGIYSSVDITPKYSGVIIKGTEEAFVENFNVSASDITFEDLTICGKVDKLTGIICVSNVQNILVKNCHFIENGSITNNGDKITDASLIENLVVDGCSFEGVSDTAIRVTKYNNLTVKNCSFKQIGYNALQVGEHLNQGEVLISNNTFISVDSRVLYLVRVDNLDSCLIENNIFYNHHNVYISDASLDKTNKRKSNGVYVCTKTTDENIITIGVNSWINIPLDDNKYISTPINYNPSIQQQYSLIKN